MLPAVVLAKEDLGPEPASFKDLGQMITNILNIILRMAGIAAFIMIIVGGFQYLTAGGDPKKTQAAGQTITYAVFGLIAVIAAWFILLFIKKFTGVDITITNLDFNFVGF